MSEAAGPDQVRAVTPAGSRRRVRSALSAAQFEDACDEELVAAASGDDRALEVLLHRYRGLARAKSRSYVLVGADPEDIGQEAMIGLYKAIGDYNPRLQTSFRTFAELCMARQILTAIKTATRRKHGPLNTYISFHRPMHVDVEGSCTLADVFPGPAFTDPAEQVIATERIRDLQRLIDSVLSDLEAEVLWHYVDGRGYQEIARVLQRHTKSIDNALQRIKRKLDSHLMAWDAEIA